MKIICTKAEKELILQAFKDSNICLFDTFGVLCSYNCSVCVEKRIEWEIKDGDGE